MSPIRVATSTASRTRLDVAAGQLRPQAQRVDQRALVARLAADALVEIDERPMARVDRQGAPQRLDGAIVLGIDVQRVAHHLGALVERLARSQPERGEPVDRVRRRVRSALPRLRLDVQRQDARLLVGVAEAAVDAVERAQ